MTTHITSKYGMVVPNGDDLISNGDDLQRAWADWLDANIATADKGLIAARPAFGHSGKFWWSTDTGTLDFDTGTAWVRLRLSVARREGRTFTMDDLTAVALSGSAFKLGMFWVPIATGQTTSLISANHRLDTGTSVSWKLQRATAGGVFTDISGWGTTASPIVTTSTTAQGATLDPADVTLADGDALAVWIVATSGSPKGFDVNINLEHT